MKRILSIAVVAAFFVGCAEKEKALTLSPSSATLHHDDQQYVHIIGEPTGVEWFSENEFVAKVDNGTITGNHLGMTVVYAQLNNKKGACAVTVTPKYFTYEEPLIDWSLTKTDVINIKGTPIKQNGDNIYYQQSTNIVEAYNFSGGRLSQSGVLLPITAVSTADFLLERYELVTHATKNSVDMYGFINASTLDAANLMVVLTLGASNDIIGVSYAPWDGTSNSSARASMKKMAQIIME